MKTEKPIKSNVEILHTALSQQNEYVGPHLRQLIYDVMNQFADQFKVELSEGEIRQIVNKEFKYAPDAILEKGFNKQYDSYADGFKQGLSYNNREELLNDFGNFLIRHGVNNSNGVAEKVKDYLTSINKGK